MLAELITSSVAELCLADEKSPSSSVSTTSTTSTTSTASTTIAETPLATICINKYVPTNATLPETVMQISGGVSVPLVIMHGGSLAAATPGPAVQFIYGLLGVSTTIIVFENGSAQTYCTVPQTLLEEAHDVMEEHLRGGPDPMSIRRTVKIQSLNVPCIQPKISPEVKKVYKAFGIKTIMVMEEGTIKSMLSPRHCPAGLSAHAIGINRTITAKLPVDGIRLHTYYANIADYGPVEQTLAALSGAKYISVNPPQGGPAAAVMVGTRACDEMLARLSIHI